MPVTLQQVASNTAHVKLDIQTGDEVNTLNVTYYPGHVTEETFGHLQKFDNMAEGDIVASFESLNEVLVTLIKTWDLYEDEKQTKNYPIEAETLKKLPIPFRMSVLQAIMGDIRPNQIAPQTTS